MISISEDKCICPVCRRHHFRQPNSFEECPVCGWVDDATQRLDPDYKTGFNRKSLNQAIKDFNMYILNKTSIA